MKKITRANIYIESDLWKAVRIAALERNMSASRLLVFALRRYLKKVEASHVQG